MDNELYKILECRIRVTRQLHLGFDIHVYVHSLQDDLLEQCSKPEDLTAGKYRFAAA